jgi:hypothetical protein
MNNLEQHLESTDPLIVTDDIVVFPLEHEESEKPFYDLRGTAILEKLFDTTSGIEKELEVQGRNRYIIAFKEGGSVNNMQTFTIGAIPDATFLDEVEFHLRVMEDADDTYEELYDVLSKVICKETAEQKLKHRQGPEFIEAIDDRIEEPLDMDLLMDTVVDDFMDNYEQADAEEQQEIAEMLGVK